MVNEVRNPGFEDNAIWATYSGHGGVVDRHVAGGHLGSFAGRTDTIDSLPYPPLGYATLQQSIVNQPLVSNFEDRDGTLRFWLVALALGDHGIYTFEVMIWGHSGIQAHVLHYFWHSSSVGVPGDSSENKYIDMGTSAPSEWTEISRNFRQDYVGKFGPESPSYYIYQIALKSWGWHIEVPYWQKGQDLRWDDILLESLVAPGCNPGLAGTSVQFPAGGE